MRIGSMASVAAVLALAACGARTAPPAGDGRGGHAGRPYRLYTHCGIEWARINGRFWRARRPPLGGPGRPPSGWGDPFQNGRLVFTTPSTARFESSAGSVTFERTSRMRPPVICS